MAFELDRAVDVAVGAVYSDAVDDGLEDLAQDGGIAGAEEGGEAFGERGNLRGGESGRGFGGIPFDGLEIGIGLGFFQFEGV